MNDPQVDRVPIRDLEDRLGIKTAALYKRLDALKQLGVHSIREGRNVYFPTQYLPLLDALDQHLKAQGTVAEFIAKQGGKLLPQNPGQNSASAEQSIPVAEQKSFRFAPLPLSLTSITDELQKLFPTFWAIGEITLTRLITPFITAQESMNGQLDRLNQNVENLVTTVATVTQVSPEVQHLNNHVLPQYERIKVALALFDSCAQTGALLPTSQIALFLNLAAKTITKKTTFQRHGYIFTRAGKEGREYVWKISKPLIEGT